MEAEDTKILQEASDMTTASKHQEAIDLLLTRLPSNQKALLMVGSIYEHSLKDEEKALDFYNKASHLGAVEGHYLAGFLLLHRDQTNAALERLQIAADANNPKALLLLCSIFASGDAQQNPHYNPQAAFDCCRRSAELHERNAQFLLGTFYADGEMVKQDFALAKEWFEKAADAGFVEAQFMLSQSSNGAGKLLDEAARCVWLERAAGNGHSEALFQLAEMRLSQNHAAEAVRLFTYSAEEGHAEAQFKLFTIFIEGKIVDKNEVQAFKWCGQAAIGGHVEAMYHIALRLQQQKHNDAAAEWFRKAAAKNHQPSIDALQRINSN